MVIGNPDAVAAAAAVSAGGGGGANSLAHPSGIPQDKIDNIMSGIANTGDVKMNNHRKKLRQRFDIIKKLGQGTYGKVQLGINKETGQEVAIKTIKKCKIEAEADLVRIRREVQIMSSVQHPNIIHIYEVFENREKMVLVMEFAAGGELYDYLSERKVLSEEEARRIFRQVATAVYYCHKHKICHRDLKLENILLDEQGNAKIADFGLSNVFDDQRLLATFCGSPLYASPEIVEGTPYQGPEVDCWSLGVLLYTLVYGSMPFDGSNFKRLVKQISQGDYYEPKKPSRASSLIRDMLTVCPRKRATIEQICSHWWVNENDNVSCLDLAEDLANQTPVRLDVLLSLTPAAITADQLVVPSADGSAANKGNERVPRSHSVGSIRDTMGPNTEAERRILDMVAAGGEAALMPSPTRTITPAQSPVQSKRKLETTVSTENAMGALKKKEKPGSSSLVIAEDTVSLSEETPMEIEEALIEEAPPTPAVKNANSFSVKDMEVVGDLCEKLMGDKAAAGAESAAAAAPTVARQKTVGKLDAVEESPEEKDATKVIKKFVNKHKTADLINAIGQIAPEKANDASTAPATPAPTTPAKAAPAPTATPTAAAPAAAPFVRKCSLQDETSLNKFNTEQRRKSRILETATKFAQMNAGNGTEKPKKFVIPGVSVGSFKKEFERKASITTPAQQGPTAGERRALEQVAAAAAAAEAQEAAPSPPGTPPNAASALESSDSKNSVASLSLEDARRSMENSIALLRQAQNESSKEVDQLCAKTESIGVSDNVGDPFSTERERKLKNARAIIGNAIQPVIRRPLPPPQSPSSPFFSGIGGGGYGQMRATSGGYFGYTSGGGSGNSAPPPYTIAAVNAVGRYSPTQISTPASLTPANANVALVAAARQHIMGRLAAGAHNSAFHQPNSQNPFYNSNSQQLQQQQQQQQQSLQQPNQARFQQAQQVPPHSQQQPQKQLHHIAFAPNSYAASAPVATAASANLNATTTTTTNSVPKPFYNAPPPSVFFKSSPGGSGDPNTVKTSTATITLKSATLPRRKTAKTEIQLEIKPRIAEQPQPSMRFTTEMQHPVADLRSAPPREGPVPYSPIKTILNARAASLEPKEHIIQIQRQQPAYSRTASNTTTRSGSLSRQSTNDSESDTTTTNMSQSTITGSSQPIKKSPREFIIPIAVEGGGFITPREGSIEPSESSRFRSTRRINSLLNDSGIDEGSPFQKMRTASSNRDVDDEPRITLHKLRSSRPVKKISQENDSQSSGEEDDDDGFEILTAESLFSTLLQRVRALTNRMNVNNDITTGFPDSRRLLSNMRQAHPFWNQEPFGRSQVSYTYSETVERKHVRLNNSAAGNNAMGTGVPWRHDLGTGMDSIFSRTGATLPRGNKSVKTNSTIAEDGATTSVNLDATNPKRTPKKEAAADEPLDLADLDLSRLRLSKKDLDTLSSITPGLPKCFQEQLLAKLPPTQARKLSRTLSMQNSTPKPTVKIYKRSQSGGRGVIHEATNDLKESLAEESASLTPPSTSGASKTTDESAERNSSQIYRRSLSRTRYDYESGIPSPIDSATLKSRSNSVCRDDYSRSLCSSYTSDINDKYKYYSPYLSKSLKDSSTESGSISPQKRYSSVSPRESVSSTLGLGRPPSGCLSPPPIAADGGSSSLRRRSSQRRISRFLRPDFFEEPLDENPYQREKKLRERETQSVLREIREKSRESSRERLSQSTYDDPLIRKHSLPSEESDIGQKLGVRHVRNKSMETYTDCQTSSSSQEAVRRHRRSLSRPREDSCEDIDKHELADKILQELQLLSNYRTQQEKQRLSVPREISVERSTEIVTTITKNKENEMATKDDEKTATIKKVKKVKPKEKSTESSTEPDCKITTTVVRKVKKIVKKSDSVKTPTIEVAPSLPSSEGIQLASADAETSKKESKIKRPKSYPTKEPGSVVTIKTDVPCAALPSKLPLKPSSTLQETCAELSNPSATCNAGLAARESRLIRPKSYPASKLTPPTTSKLVAEAYGGGCSGTTKTNSISGQSSADDKSVSVTPTEKNSVDTSSSSESRPTTIKKIIKVSKKSKLAQPIPLTPTTPTVATDSQECVSNTKEKSPEKKPSKGLFYAIGQKFEKLRDSAMNKEKKLSASSSASAAACAAAQKTSSDNSSPEKIKAKTTLLKKKKSLDSSSTKTEKARGENTAKTPSNLNETEKLIKTDKRSRIDSMIRSLRERSVPRSHNITESNYIKRAVSVEEMPGTFNRNAVNKVLGLFKRFDKDGGERRVQSTRSTSNIERQIRESSQSPIYQNTTTECLRSGDALRNKSSSSIVKAESARGETICNCEMLTPKVPKSACPECLHDQAASLMTKRRDDTNTPKPGMDVATVAKEQAPGNKDRRKGLMLDLGKADKVDNSSNRNLKAAYINGNGIYSNLPPYPGAVNSSSNNSSSQQSVDNATNNNNNNNNTCTTNNNSSQTSGYRTSSAHEINRNHLLTPSTENIANYSSDSRSYQDDCASTSTFLSPTDEPELCFDNWSICSEDNYMLHATPSPTVSRLSRASQLSSPTRGESSDPNESVIDRIKRRSFYCRFNDKKPKRTSSIVGPSAVRDYYREQQAAVKARSNNKLNKPEEQRAKSPDITQEFFRPLKLSPVGTELKPPIYHRSPLDYSSTACKPRKSLNDIRPSTSPSFLSKRYGSTVDSERDYLSLSSALPTRFKSSSSSSPYESNGGVTTGTGASSYYNTYNPKRRSSYTLNGTLPSSASSTVKSAHIDGYATVGRRSIRPYDQRTMSLLDPSTVGASSYRREARTPVRDYTSSIGRSTSRYRTSSSSRSPTNI